MNIIDVRKIQKEEGRRGTYKLNLYIHPDSNYIGYLQNGGTHIRNGGVFKSSYSFMRQTKKLFTLDKFGFPKAFGYGYPIGRSASNIRKWYGSKIPSTGWQKVQFVYHEPIAFEKENPKNFRAEFYKFLINQL